MRILMLLESYEGNGIATSVKLSAKTLRQMGHEVRIFTPDPLDPNVIDPPFVYRCPAVEGHVYTNTDYTKWLPIVRPQLVELIKWADVVHIHHLYPVQMWAINHCHRIGKPVVVTNHTQLIEYASHVPRVLTGIPKRMAIRFRPQIEKAVRKVAHRAMSQADAVIAPSEHTANSLRAVYQVERPISVIPTAIDLPKNALSAANLAKAKKLLKQKGLPDGVPFGIYVGRVAEEKNIYLLIEAIKIFLKDNPEAWFVLVGKVDELAGYQELCKDLPVIFTGFVDPRLIPALNFLARIFVLASVTDTQAIVVGEALATGTQVVVMRKGGPPEAIDGKPGFEEGSLGRIVEENTPEALADGMDKGWNNPNSPGAITAACRAVPRRYSPSAMADKLEETYETSIDACRKGRASRSQ